MVVITPCIFRYHLVDGGPCRWQFVSFSNVAMNAVNRSFNNVDSVCLTWILAYRYAEPCPVMTSYRPSPVLRPNFSLQNRMIGSHSFLLRGIPSSPSRLTSTTTSNAFLYATIDALSDTLENASIGVVHFFGAVEYEINGPEIETTDPSIWWASRQ